MGVGDGRLGHPWAWHSVSSGHSAAGSGLGRGSGCLGSRIQPNSGCTGPSQPCLRSETTTSLGAPRCVPSRNQLRRPGRMSSVVKKDDFSRWRPSSRLKQRAGKVGECASPKEKPAQPEHVPWRLSRQAQTAAQVAQQHRWAAVQGTLGPDYVVLLPY